MAARSQSELSAEGKGILKKFGIQVFTGDNVGQAGGEEPEAVTTMDQAKLRFLALILEVLINIRQGEQNP